MKTTLLLTSAFCLLIQNIWGQEEYQQINRKPRHYELNLRVGDRYIPITTHNGQIPNEQQLMLINSVLTEDFLVNDDIGNTQQWDPQIAMDGAGNFVIVWEDFRNANYDIYFQRYNSMGITLGTNTKVNDDAGTTWQRSSSIAMNGSGNFVIVWEDERNGYVNPDIYYQRYNSNGVAQGINIKANDDAGTADQLQPSIAMDGAGNFVITWKDGRNGNWDIYYQRYNNSGIAQGINTKANDDAGTTDQLQPSIAKDGSGNFVITWTDGRNDNRDIYYQRYNSSGIAQGVNTKANDDTGSESQWGPSIDMDGAGNFVIVWFDFRNNNPDIYYQRYNSNGAGQGINTKVNDDAGISDQWYPSIAMDVSGNFVIAWGDSRNGNWDIYYQRYDSIGTAQGVNTEANDDAGAAYQNYPSIVVDEAGNFVIVWEDARNGYSDIYYQRYNSSGITQGVNTKANEEFSTADQLSSSIAMDDSGNFVIVWKDERRDWSYPDIYFQQYNSNGTPLGNNRKANSDNILNVTYNPAIAIDGGGNFVITWEDNRNQNQDIYFQRYNNSGVSQGTNTQANDDAGSALQWSPTIAMDGGGDFTIAWTDYRNGKLDIYYQRYNSSGVAQGINTKANDDAGSTLLWSPTIAMDEEGNFVIAWEDNRNRYYNNTDIYYQRYNSNGVAQGINTKANDDAGTADQLQPSIAMDGAGNFVITWKDGRNGNWDIYYQRYDSIGTAQGVDTKANDDAGAANQDSPSIAVDEAGNFVIVWEDYRYSFNNSDIIGQRYFSNGSTNGSNYRIIADLSIYGEKAPVVAANNNKLIFSWMDSRFSLHWDIFAKIVNWDWSGIPVELTSFTASADGKEVTLNWSTATELNNLGFEVQRKFGNNDFATIGSIKGHGTTTSPNQYSYVDKLINAGKYFYRLKQLDYSGSFEFSETIEINVISIDQFILEQNYPNPFNPSTKIRYAIPASPNPSEGWALVQLKVYDVLGNEIATLVDEEKPTGSYEVEFPNVGMRHASSATNVLPSGVYFYQLKAGPSSGSGQVFVETKKMILLR